MSKVLGISLGVGTDVFDFMRAYGIEADYIPPDGVREFIGFPTVRRQFSLLENQMLKEGRAKEYFGSVQKMPEFWDKYVNDSVFLAKPVRADERVTQCRSGKIDFKSYDAVAITALDDYHKPLESLLSYLDGVCQKPAVVGGHIVKDSTIPILEKAPGKALFNKGSFDGFAKFLGGSKPGRVIEGGGPLKIDSAKVLMKAGYAVENNFFTEIKDCKGVTCISGEPYAHFKILGLSGCGNGCDYCSSPPSLSVSKEVWADAIDRLSRKHKKAALDIRDDNCFKHPGIYRDIFSRVYSKFDVVKVNTYLDVRNLISNADSERLFESIVSSPKTQDIALFFGRECADEGAAKAIGRKFEGLVRSQAMLDSDKERIKQVIASLDKRGLKYETKISYVLGPGGNEAIENIRRDALDLKGCGSGVIVPQIQPLYAYPGTECHERYKGDLMSTFPGVSISNLDFENIAEFEKTGPRIM
jgi:hypothetical protein